MTMRTKDQKLLFLDMQEHPESYTDEQLEYMMDQLDQAPDVQQAWQEFDASHAAAISKTHFAALSSIRKVAAIFVGVLLLSGIAFAAIHIVHQYQKMDTPQVADTTAVANSSPFNHHYSLPEDTTTVQPVIYDNIPLEKMLPEIAAHYNVEVTFANEAVRSLRFHFVWNPGQNIANVVNDLNRFENLHTTLKDHQLIVE